MSGTGLSGTDAGEDRLREPGIGESDRDRDLAATGVRDTAVRDTGQRGDGSTMLPPDEREKLFQRLQHAVNEFIDEPRRSVEDADEVFEELTERITAGLAERRRALRAPWREQETGEGTGQTEELRVALRQYREQVEQLLRL